MTSVGYTNPISASGGKTLILPGRISSLGGGIPGFIPQATYNTNNNNSLLTLVLRLSKPGIQITQEV